jgi:hypothetical protein
MASRGGHNLNIQPSFPNVHTSDYRHYFFEGVFENLDGITYIPNRGFAFALAVVNRFSHFLEQDPSRLSRCVLATIRVELWNTHVWQPYIPHIAFMYASGMKEAETVYCTVGVSSNSNLICSHILVLFAGKDQKSQSILC